MISERHLNVSDRGENDGAGTSTFKRKAREEFLARLSLRFAKVLRKRLNDDEESVLAGLLNPKQELQVDARAIRQRSPQGNRPGT